MVKGYLVMGWLFLGPLALGSVFHRHDHCVLAVLQPSQKGEKELQAAQQAISHLLAQFANSPDVPSFGRNQLRLFPVGAPDIEQSRSSDHQRGYAQGLGKDLWLESLGLVRGELGRWKNALETWSQDPQLVMANVVVGKEALENHFATLEKAVEAQISPLSPEWHWTEKGFLGAVASVTLSTIATFLLQSYVFDIDPQVVLGVDLGAALVGGAAGAMIPLPKKKKTSPPYRHFKVADFQGVPLWDLGEEIAWVPPAQNPIYYLRVLRHSGREVLLVLYREGGTFKLLQLARWLPLVDSLGPFRDAP